MAEALSKVTNAAEKIDPLAGVAKRSGFRFLSDSFEDTAEFAKSDRERIKRDEAAFSEKRRRAKAETFKPKTPGSVSSESLLTRKV